MADLHSRFRVVDQTPVPDLWPDIAHREPGPGPSRDLWRRTGVAAAALLVAALAFTYLARAFLAATRPGDGPTPTPTGLFRPEPKTNGLIAFVRTDPESMIQEGGFPLSDLYTVEPNGSGVRRLVGEQGYLFRSAVAWSPDGTRIAFPWGEGPMRVMTVDGTEDIVRYVTCELPNCEGNRNPSWSPKGDQLAFSRFDGQRDHLWVGNADGAAAKPLNQEFVTIVHVAWSPDGSVIAVLGFAGPGPEVGTYHVNLVDPESGEIIRTLNAPPGLEFAGTISWSPDGRSVAFDTYGEGGVPEGSGVYVMQADGTDVRPLSICPAERPGGCTDMHPAWSPDGSQIAFTRALSERGSDGFMGDIFVIDAEGGEVRRVTGGPGLDCCPAWQPVPAD